AEERRARADRRVSPLVAPALSGVGAAGARSRSEGEVNLDMAARLQCRFFLLRYAPDAVKNEFVNIGLVLLPPAGSAEVRFTRDWSRVRCLDPQADIEVLEALEADLREKLREMNGDHEFILRRIQDSFSNALQPTEFQGCLAESPAREADELARL